MKICRWNPDDESHLIRFIKENPEAQHLDLSGCGLETLPPEIEQLKNLTVIPWSASRQRQ
jgi:hypothetical protein